MRPEVTQREVLALIPKPCVVGSNPTGGAKKSCLTRSYLAWTKIGREPLAFMDSHIS